MTLQDNMSGNESYKNKLYVLKEPNYYKILGVELNADIDAISKEYRTLAKQFHPDKNSHLSEIQKKEVSQIFQRITTAFNALKDPETRKEHDFQLRRLEEVLKAQMKAAEVKTQAESPQPQNQNSSINPNLKSTNISFTFSQLKPVDIDQIRAEKEKKDKEKAITDFAQAKKFLNEKKYDDAVNLLRGLTEKFGAIATYHSHLGLAMEEKGWNGYAQAEYKVALHFDPNDQIALKHYVPSGSKKVKEEEKKFDMENTQNLKSVIGKFKSLFNKS